MTITIRKRIFVAVEGDSERSFIRWLQELCDQSGLHVHLDPILLHGGGYETMLTTAVDQGKRREASKSKATCSILLVDSDRAQNGDDPWSKTKLREKALKNKFIVCFQDPKHEGILLRMHPGGEGLKLNSCDTDKLLERKWKTYKKPVDAQLLRSKFALEDLLRAAQVDEELKKLLITIGLMKDS